MMRREKDEFNHCTEGRLSQNIGWEWELGIEKPRPFEGGRREKFFRDVFFLLNLVSHGEKIETLTGSVLECLGRKKNRFS
jgi:hypothetical protein